MKVVNVTMKTSIVHGNVKFQCKTKDNNTWCL